MFSCREVKNGSIRSVQNIVSPEILGLFRRLSKRHYPKKKKIIYIRIPRRCTFFIRKVVLDRSDLTSLESQPATLAAQTDNLRTKSGRDRS